MPNTPSTEPEAARVDLPGGFYIDRDPKYPWVRALRAPDRTHHRVWTTEQMDAFAAAMSTPTPGRAAEPDAMGEVERLLQAFDDAAQAHGWESDQGTGDAPAKAEEAWRDAYAALHLGITLAMSDLRTRAETAEAQLATLRVEVEKVKVPADLVALSEKAPPGPWRRSHWAVFTNDTLICLCDGKWYGKEVHRNADCARLIVAAVNYVRALSNPKADR